MEVILLDRVINLGKLGDLVNVKPGYARNYLFPRGKATRATKANLAAFEARRAELEQKAGDALTAAEGRARQIASLAIQLTAKTSDEGQLFGSINSKMIADAITAAGVLVHKQEVRLSKALRELGKHEITLHLHPEVNTVVKIEIIAEA